MRSHRPGLPRRWNNICCGWLQSCVCPVKAREWYFLFSAYDFFCQSQCLPSFNHSILAPTDNGIKMSHAFIMSKSLNHTNVCVWLLSVLACNYNQKVWMTLALFPFCSTGSSEWLRWNSAYFLLCGHIVLLAHHHCVANQFSFSSICHHVQSKM